jgi:hypothetical protein
MGAFEAYNHFTDMLLFHYQQRSGLIKQAVGESRNSDSFIRLLDRRLNVSQSYL